MSSSWAHRECDTMRTSPADSCFRFYKDSACERNHEDLGTSGWFTIYRIYLDEVILFDSDRHACKMMLHCATLQPLIFLPAQRCRPVSRLPSGSVTKRSACRHGREVLGQRLPRDTFVTSPDCITSDLGLSCCTPLNRATSWRARAFFRTFASGPHGPILEPACDNRRVI